MKILNGIKKFFICLIAGIAALLVFVIALPFIIIASVVGGIKKLFTPKHNRTKTMSFSEFINIIKAKAPVHSW